MADITIPGMFLTGDHASRPASDVGDGTLYACSTHGLIYQTLNGGSSWSTWATLGSGSGVATDTIWNAAGDLAVGTGSDAAARLGIGSNGTILTSNGTTATWASPGAGATPAGVDLIRMYPQGSNNSTSQTTTISSVASGVRFVHCVSSYNRDVDSVTCTNVTWTEVLAVTFGGGAFLSVYVGVATGASGTSIVTSCTGSNWIITDTYVINDTLTPTAGSSTTLTNTDASAMSNVSIPALTAAAGDFFIAAVAQNDGTTGFRNLLSSEPLIRTDRTGGNDALASGIGRATKNKITAWASGGSSGGDYAGGIVIVS